jgi:hypothetical protein
MALSLLDTDYNNYGNDPYRSFHDGFSGQTHENKFYIRNTDKTRYYTNVVVQPKFRDGYNDLGVSGNTGWSIKVMYGELQPTEEEWSLVKSGDALKIPDIGSEFSPDTVINHPIWVRIFCPGSTSAQIKENMYVSISYFEKVCK